MTATMMKPQVQEQERLHEAIQQAPQAPAYAWVEQLGRRRLLSLKQYLVMKRVFDVAV